MKYFKDRRRWGSEEDMLLSETYPVSGVEGARVAFPERTISSIMARVKRLGLSRSGTGSMKYWTGAEVIKLRRMWGNYKKEDIQEELGDRNWRAITSKARKLGVFRNYHVRRPLPETDIPVLCDIRRRMADRMFTSTEIQEVAGLKRGALRHWFRGEVRPNFFNVLRVIDALDGELVVRWRNDE